MLWDDRYVPEDPALGQSLLGRNSAAVIRQTSIDDLFNDINQTISSANASTDSFDVFKTTGDSFMVDDGFINDIATPVDDSKDESPVPPHRYQESNGRSSEKTENYGHHRQQPSGTFSVDSHAHGRTNGPSQPGLGSSPAKSGARDSTKFAFDSHAHSSTRNLPPSTPSYASAAASAAYGTGSIAQGRGNEKTNINFAMLSAYEIHAVVKYVEVILYSIPMKELHITVLGTLFHRGTENAIPDKATRKYLFQQTIEVGVNNGNLIRKGDSVVDFIVALNKTFVKSSVNTYTFLEKNVMWILKDEYQHLDNVRSANQADHYRTLDNSEYVQVKTLQYAAKVKQMRNGLFIFPLCLNYDNGQSSVTIPPEFLVEIPCENSSYAVLFQQSLQHFAELKIVEYSNNLAGVRLVDKVRRAIQSPALESDGFESRKIQKVTGADGQTRALPVAPTLSQTVESVATNTPPAEPANATQPTAGAIALPLSPDPNGMPSPIGVVSAVPRSTSHSYDKSLPWVPQGNFMVLEFPLDKATVIQVPSLLKMAAVSDAMDVGTIQRLERDTGCKVRDISIKLTVAPGKFAEEYRLLIKGGDEGSRQICLEKLKRIMNASRSTVTDMFNTADSDAVIRAPARDSVSSGRDDGDVYEGEDDREDRQADGSAHHSLRIRANEIVDIDARWEHPWGDSFSERVMEQPVYIYYDWSNCQIQVTEIAKVVKLATQGRAPVKRRVVAGSCTKMVDKESLDRHWNVYHEFDAHFLVQPGKREIFIDDFLHAHITQDVAAEAIARSLKMSFGDHDEIRPVLVLFSNDTNDNVDGVIGSTFPRCLQFALDNGWSVEVWVNCNQRSLSHFHKWKRSQLGRRYKIFFLQEFVRPDARYQMSMNAKNAFVRPFNPKEDL